MAEILAILPEILHMGSSTIAKAAAQAEGGTPSASPENESELQELVLPALSSGIAMKNMTTMHLHARVEPVSEQDVVRVRPMAFTLERTGEKAGEVRRSASKTGKGTISSSRSGPRKVSAHRHGVGSLDDIMTRRSTPSTGAQLLALSLPLVGEGKASIGILGLRHAMLPRGQA